MPLTYLHPIQEKEVLKEYAYERIGGRIGKHTSKDGLPSLEGVQIGIVVLTDNLNAGSVSFRQYFYELFVGNWQVSIADLGNLFLGNTPEDTYSVVREIVYYLISKGITPVVVAKNQEVTYALYRAFDKMEQWVNMVCIDAVFDFGNQHEFVCPHSYMSRILTEKPTNLNHFCNIGYQTYYNAQETIDVLDRMYFESYRLGQVVSDLEQLEPILRNTDIVSIDMRSIQASDLDWNEGFPNGFSNREICAIARYAGLSMQTSVLGIFEIPNTCRALQLMAQIIWYFVEGYNYRVVEFPTIHDVNFTKYSVLIDDMTIEFYKSNFTGRWWILPECYSQGISMLACSQKDYDLACKGVIPERWWNLIRKTSI